MEAVADGSRVDHPVGGLFAGQGRDVRAYRHVGRTVVGGRGRGQTSRSPQHDCPSAVDRALSGGATAGARTARTPARIGLRPATARTVQERPRSRGDAGQVNRRRTLQIRHDRVMTEQEKIEVRDNPSDQRYDVFVDGSLDGSTFYRTYPDLVIFTHTEIDPAYEGRGVGSALARAALGDARRQGKHVIPQCPFIAGYIRRHDEYVDLVDERFRGSFSRSNT